MFSNRGIGAAQMRKLHESSFSKDKKMMRDRGNAKVGDNHLIRCTNNSHVDSPTRLG